MKRQTFQARTAVRVLLADTVTPVSIYLRLRDQFSESILLEGNDFADAESAYSYICCDPVARYSVDRDEAHLSYPDGSNERLTCKNPSDFVDSLQTFLRAFTPDPSVKLACISNGLFGYMSYDAAQLVEDIAFKNTGEGDSAHIPRVQYTAYRYVIAINHFKNELYLLEHDYEGLPKDGKLDLDDLQYQLSNKAFPQYAFYLDDRESGDIDDASFIEMVREGIRHVHRGDVFQLVLSRRYSVGFQGDEFNVYRALRSINPSPYLFYFDCGDFKIFGSSPESQLVVEDSQATINPIAGTFRRSGDSVADARLAESLQQDPKENAEHVMLVDLARNDLSKHSEAVNVDQFREVHMYSHVIHLVSKVRGKLMHGISPIQVAADTFPAGTLTGAPKYRAMELIDQYESHARSFYGGSIGYLGFDGDYKHAIVIRSLLSKNNRLFYQAGAGVVADSDPEKELKEVGNKLAALRAAIEAATSEEEER